jgi:hypothetical protein
VPDWLFEGRPSVYVVLAAMTVLLLLAWWQTRKRGVLITAAVVAGLIGLYAALDKMVETDGEQIVRKVREMVIAVNERDMKKLSENISDNFRSRNAKTKQEFVNEVAPYVQSRVVQNVRVWDIVCEGSPSRDPQPARVFFSAKAESGRELLADCEATFDFDAQHGWRLQSIRLFKPQTTEEWPIQL